MSAAKKKKADPTKGDVIHIRAAPLDKSLIEKAADSLGLTISSFILQNAIKAARRELSEVEKTSLSQKDAELFFSALKAAPAPNAALKAAFKDYSTQLKK